MNEDRLGDLATRWKRRPGRGLRRVSRFVLFFEDLVKVPVFRCQQCGECILSHTAYICSQRCPKRMRNGPCGGTGSGGTCEVYPDRPCIWQRIHRRALRWNRLPLLHRIEKIHNWGLENSSAWINVLRKETEPPTWIVRKDNRHDLEG